MKNFKNYIKAARLRTLPLSVSGIIVGCFLGLHDSLNTTSLINSNIISIILQNSIFWLAILTTIGFQILSNFANDYGDGIKGTDNERTGEARMVSSGAISPSQMKKAMLITGLISLGFALGLIFQAFGSNNFLYTCLFFFLTIASIVAAIKYTVGNTAYGYSGFGDIFVFVFFGLLAVMGSYFLFTKTISFTILFPAFSVGLLSTAVLNLNNMRDKKNDAKAGKNTIVVKIGMEFAKYYHYYLIGSSLLFALLFTTIKFHSPIQFLFLLAYIPLVKHLFFVANNKNEALLDGELKKVALSTFLFAILFSLGNILYV